MGRKYFISLSMAIALTGTTLCWGAANNADTNKNLLEAVKNNDIDALDQALKTWNVNINTPDSKGRTPLILATSKGYEEIVNKLIIAGANVNARDKHDWTALMRAAEKNYAPIVELLLKDVMIKINLRNNEYKTALKIARENQAEEVKKILKRRSKYEEIKSDSVELERDNAKRKRAENNNALSQNAKRKRLEQAERMERHEAEQMLLAQEEEEQRQFAQKEEEQKKREQAAQKLILEQQQREAKAAEAMLRRREAVQRQHEEAQRQREEAQRQREEAERKRQEEVDRKQRAADEQKRQLQEAKQDIINAVENNDLSKFDQALKMLNQNKIFIDQLVKDNEGRTLLMLAAERGYEQITAKLIKNGAYGVYIDAITRNGDSPLMLATLGNHIEVVNQLINAHAFVDLKNNNGWTALMYAAKHNYAPIIEALLEKGRAQADLRNKSGQTALHIAQTNGALNAARILQEREDIERAKHEEAERQWQEERKRQAEADQRWREEAERKWQEELKRQAEAAKREQEQKAQQDAARRIARNGIPYTQSHYATLRILKPARLENISQADIVKAFRSLAFVVHPDKNKTPNADEQMKALNIARDVLVNPAQRGLYDVTVNMN